MTKFIDCKFLTVLRIILLLDEKLSAYHNARKAGVTDAFYLTIIHDLKNHGIVDITKSGRSNIIRFTELGKELHDKLKDINDIMNKTYLFSVYTSKILVNS